MIGRSYLSACTGALLVLCAAAVAAQDAGQTDKLAAAAELRLTGHYEEAAAAYRHLLEEQPVLAAVGLARCLYATGQLGQAEQVLQQAAAQHQQAAALRAELARLAFGRGDLDAARRHADAALQLDEHQLLARWIAAELDRACGRLEAADEGYQWLVRFYDRSRGAINDPDQLRWIGLAMARDARWNRRSQRFSYLVNRLYPRALELSRNYWPAHLEAARLFLEKYNEAEATNSLNAALAINPNAAEVHAARARLALQHFDLSAAALSIERALQINPRLVEAHRLQADLLTAGFRLRAAAQRLEEVRKLNPAAEETLGRLAAVYTALDGPPPDQSGSRSRRLIDEAVRHNEHCGQFFFTMGSTFELLRRYPLAAWAYEQARQRMPQLIGARGRLGLTYMRLGDEQRGAKLLDESFRIDPFNVRVKNMLAVIDVLKRYQSLETEHFIIKFDPQRDALLADSAAQYLEGEVYPQLVAAFDYRPQGKTLIEVFSRSGHTSGHGWFSARMVGLPSIGTVAACAGKMVALVSPNDMPKPYNWARVLRHEFVHVLNLQQTDFNIPHWFTEALAVWHEGYQPPGLWDEVLARRHAAGKLYNLDTINLGLLRPGSGDDWTLAYCQAWLYARYMVETFGPDALSKMVAAYAQNLSTGDAIEQCFGISQQQLEEGYARYVDQRVRSSGLAAASEPASLAELLKAVQKQPQDPDRLARLAYAWLQRGDKPQARRLALAACQLDKRHQLASYVLARLQLSIGDVQQAVKLLEEALDEQEPQANCLALLAGLHLRAKRYDEAARLYKLGRQRFPGQEKWLRWLARVYLASGQEDPLAEVLAELAQRNADDLAVRKKLAQLALNRNDSGAAVKWANQALRINVMDGVVRQMLAEALAAQGQVDQAIQQYRTAILLEPEQLSWQLALARLCAEHGRPDEARQVLEQLLARDPEHQEARQMWKALRP